MCSEPTPHLSAFITHHKSLTLIAKAEVKRPKGEFTDNELGSLICIVCVALVPEDYAHHLHGITHLASQS